MGARKGTARLVALSALALTACSLDATGTTGATTTSGSTSGGTTGSMTSTGSLTTSTESTGSAMTSGVSTGSSMGGTGGMATTSSASSNSASSSDASSTSASSSSGGPTTIPFCTPVTDDFNGYANAMAFASAPNWGEVHTDGLNTINANAATIVVGSSTLSPHFYDAQTVLSSTTPCAATLDLVSVSAGGNAEFGFVNDPTATTTLQTATIVFSENNGKLVAIGTGSGSMVTLPVTLAIVLIPNAGNDPNVKSFYKSGSGMWTEIAGAGAAGTPVHWLNGNGSHLWAGAPNSALMQSTYDNYNKQAVPTSCLSATTTCN